jgi:hypothetical protein
MFKKLKHWFLIHVMGVNDSKNHVWGPDCDGGPFCEICYKSKEEL